MKAELTAAGTLVLTPETGVEAYALTRWMREAEPQPVEGRARAITLDLSQFPETLPAKVDRVRWEEVWRAAPSSPGGWGIP